MIKKVSYFYQIKMDILYLITTINYTTVVLLSTTILLITLIIILQNHKRNTYWSGKNVTVAQMPSIVNILIKKMPIHQLELYLVTKYGKTFATHLVGKPTLFCADPQIINCIISKNFTSFPNRKPITSLNEISIHMLNVVKDEKWKRIRSIVSPTFSSRKLKKMKPIIYECVQKLINDFNMAIKNNNELDVIKFFGAYTVNTIASVAFGVKLDTLNEPNNQFMAHARTIFSSDFGLIDSIKYIIQNWSVKLATILKINNLKLKEFKFFSDLGLKVIEERMSNKTEKNRNDFIGLLLEALDKKEYETENPENVGIFEEYKFTPTNKTMSPIEISAQCAIFFAAGYESSTTTLSCSAYNLACNPKMQDLLYEEAKSVLEKQDELDYDLLNSLKYTDAVVSETLRLFPPAPTITREASVDCILGDGIKISKGDCVRIPVYAVHMNPENFPEPEKFKPERFFKENCSHHPCAYIPFGGGPRSCVARRLALIEAKLAILYSVYNFRFSITDKTEVPPKLIMSPLITPKQIFLKVEKRLKAE